MIGKIQGTGAYVPPKILENQQLEKCVETSDAWIRERTGVQRRHVVCLLYTSLEACLHKCFRRIGCIMRQQNMSMKQSEMRMGSAVARRG